MIKGFLIIRNNLVLTFPKNFKLENFISPELIGLIKSPSIENIDMFGDEESWSLTKISEKKKLDIENRKKISERSSCCWAVECIREN